MEIQFNKISIVVIDSDGEKGIMEFAKDLGRNRCDMPEVVVWKEAIGVTGNKLLYMQAIHQESDVICENIDAIRAAMGFKDAEASIEKTNKSLGIDYCKECTLHPH